MAEDAVSDERYEVEPMGRVEFRFVHHASVVRVEWAAYRRSAA